jgi:hypothetical protein
MICAKREDAMQLQSILDLYEACSGQKINKAKSAVRFSRNTSDEEKQEIKGMLDIQRETMNERYLGLPVHVGRSKTEVFASLKDRVWNRIQGWKEFFLSWAAGTGDQRRMPVHDRLGPRDVGNGRMEDESPDLHLGSGPALHCAREHPGVRLHMSTQAANSHASVTNLLASDQGSDLKKAPLKPLEGCLMSSALMKARFKLICTAQDLKTILQLPRQLLNVLSETSLSQGPASSTGLVDLSLGRATDEEGKDQVGFCHKPGKDSKEIEKSVQGNVGRDDGPGEGAHLPDDELGLRLPLQSSSITPFDQLQMPALSAPGGRPQGLHKAASSPKQAAGLPSPGSGPIFAYQVQEGGHGNLEQKRW